VHAEMFEIKDEKKYQSNWCKMWKICKFQIFMFFRLKWPWFALIMVRYLNIFNTFCNLSICQIFQFYQVKKKEKNNLMWHFWELNEKIKALNRASVYVKPQICPTLVRSVTYVRIHVLYALADK